MISNLQSDKIVFNGHFSRISPFPSHSFESVMRATIISTAVQQPNFHLSQPVTYVLNIHLDQLDNQDQIR